MKNILFSGGLTILNIKFNFLPPADLLIGMALSMVLDFVTGIIKAIVQNKNRTSEGYRRTVIKFTQYGGAVALSMMINYFARTQPGLAQFSNISDYLGNGLLIFIIFIECTSILENMYAIDNGTPFSRYFIKPLLRLFTIQIKNNPVAKLDEEKSEK
ncbi:MAG TPA: phage holin family protein [Chitinophagaceae bacterium]|nr:phage holin family protein [Chitinophagaceae bacterium]